MRFFVYVMTVFMLSGPLMAGQALRIVSVGGANTEILYALGIGGQIVGSDTTSTYPQAAQETPKVGYMRALSAEGVLSLKPNLIILSEEAGPRPVLAQLTQVGVDTLTVPAARSIQDIRANIDLIADKADLGNEAVKLLAKIDQDVSRLKGEIAKDTGQKRIMFILNHGGGAPMVAGTDTAADGIIALAGAKNVVSGYTGYKPLTPEAALKLQPDYILVTEMGLETSGGLAAFRQIPGINLTRAAQEGRVIAMNSLYLLGFGPRTAEAALTLRSLMNGGRS